MADEKKQLKTETAEKKADVKSPAKSLPSGAKEALAESVYAKKRSERGGAKKSFGRKSDKAPEEFEQQIIDLARVTRVMAGGKRMRFRACVAIGDKKGRVGLGIAKGADVTLAVTKAVTNAKKKIVIVPIVEGTIPHEIFWKTGAARIMLKPARRGRGVIAGGAIRVILNLSGIQNATSKNLGTSNKVNVAKCTLEALENLKKSDKIKNEKNEKKNEAVKAETEAKKAEEKKQIAK